MKKTDIDELEILMGQLKSIHAEVSALSKKSPNDAVNAFKIKFINTIVMNCNSFLGEDYKPFNDFDVFDIDDVPSNSDVTFIISQYLEALEKYRADNIYCSMGRWYFKLEGSDENIQTAQPMKLQK